MCSRIEPTFLSWLSMCPVGGHPLGGWHNMSLRSGVRGENVAVEGYLGTHMKQFGSRRSLWTSSTYVPAKFSGNTPR
jgi:hypothetical protein